MEKTFYQIIKFKADYKISFEAFSRLGKSDILLRLSNVVHFPGRGKKTETHKYSGNYDNVNQVDLTETPPSYSLMPFTNKMVFSIAKLTFTENKGLTRAFVELKIKRGGLAVWIPALLITALLPAIMFISGFHWLIFSLSVAISVCSFFVLVISLLNKVTDFKGIIYKTLSGD